MKFSTPTLFVAAAAGLVVLAQTTNAFSPSIAKVFEMRSCTPALILKNRGEKAAERIATTTTYHAKGVDGDQRGDAHPSPFLTSGPTTWQEDLDTVLNKLVDYLYSNPVFLDQLKFSLVTAQKNASEKLDRNLYSAFGLLVPGNGWPTTIPEYLAFLTRYAQWVPQQNDYDGWLAKPNQSYDESHQEIYDRLVHFYYLINQKLNDGTTLQDDPWFSDWLVEYAKVWGKFCDSPESITPETIHSFWKLSKPFDITQSMIPINEEDIPGSINKYTIYNDKGQPLRPNTPSGWLTWNQFFARRLNPGLRPIDHPTDNTVVCAPADCTFRAAYPIDLQGNVENIKFKRTHNIGNIFELLKDSQYTKAFAGGTFVHYFLNAYSYHHFHMPVAGVVKESYAVPGRAFLDVNITNQGYFDAPDGAENGYEFSQARGVIIIDTKGSPYGDVGLVAVIPVGMAQVSGVRMIATSGAEVQKGDEFGYFQFGGSDIIMLFQEGVVPESNLVDNPNAYNLHGMQIATACIS